jgi:hypothetical protein
MKTILVSMILAMSFTVMAEELPKDHPCREIKTACEAAGFHKGDHKKNGKGLWLDCMDKLKVGEAVPGVSVSADKVAACKVKLATKKK